MKEKTDLEHAEDLRAAAINSAKIIRKNIETEYPGVTVAVMLITDDACLIGTSHVSPQMLMKACLQVVGAVSDRLMDENENDETDD